MTLTEAHLADVAASGTTLALAQHVGTALRLAAERMRGRAVPVRRAHAVPV